MFFGCSDVHLFVIYHSLVGVSKGRPVFLAGVAEDTGGERSQTAAEARAEECHNNPGVHQQLSAYMKVYLACTWKTLEICVGSHD